MAKRKGCCYTKRGAVENPGFNKWISAGSKQVRVRKVRGGVEVDMRSKPAKRKPAKRRNSAPRASRGKKRKTEKRVSSALKRFLSRR